MLHEDPNRHQQQGELLNELQFGFVTWLGESKYI